MLGHINRVHWEQSKGPNRKNEQLLSFFNMSSTSKVLNQTSHGRVKFEHMTILTL